MFSRHPSSHIILARQRSLFRGCSCLLCRGSHLCRVIFHHISSYFRMLSCVAALHSYSFHDPLLSPYARSLPCRGTQGLQCGVTSFMSPRVVSSPPLILSFVRMSCGGMSSHVMSVMSSLFISFASDGSLSHSFISRCHDSTVRPSLSFSSQISCARCHCFRRPTQSWTSFEGV